VALGGLPSAANYHIATPQQLIAREWLGVAGPFGLGLSGFDGSHDDGVVVVEVGECRIDLGRPGTCGRLHIDRN
jgi:hypothetical protein